MGGVGPLLGVTVKRLPGKIFVAIMSVKGAAGLGSVTRSPRQNVQTVSAHLQLNGTGQQSALAAILQLPWWSACPCLAPPASVLWSVCAGAAMFFWAHGKRSKTWLYISQAPLMEMQRWLQMARGPPLGSCLLMIVIICGGLLTTSRQVELHLEHLHTVWDGHRLLTHILFTSDISEFVLSSILILLLCGQLEERLGTLCYLHLSCMCTLYGAALYLLLSCLRSSSPTPASGYLGTQLALLLVERPRLPWRMSRKMTFLLPCGILIITHVLSPRSPLLYHLCGAISGLTSRSLQLLCLEWFEPWRIRLERSHLFHSLKSAPLAKFIPSGHRPVMPQDTAERSREWLPFTNRDVSQPVAFTDMPLAGIPIQAPLLAESRNIPLAFLYEDPEELENEMLRVGIQESLMEYKHHEKKLSEPTLHKSSVSAFRLQQLERMGFPTGSAVVALAATGKVDAAVSLLVEGRVGEDLKVTNERQGGL